MQSGTMTIEEIIQQHREQMQRAEDLFVETKMRLEITTAILRAYKKRMLIINGEEHFIVGQGEEYIEVSFKKKSITE
jgi:hypothetical protein